MGRLTRRLILGGVCLACLGSTGCLQVPFYLPEYGKVSATRPGCEPREVHAFRVDVTQKIELKDGPPPEFKTTGTNVENLQLTRIPLADDGTTPSQVAFNCASGWTYVGFWNFVNTCTSHAVAVRLYRPGFETIELKAGHDPREMQWHEALHLAAQERAIDNLLGANPLETSKSLSNELQRRLEPGSKSTAHRDALLFASREYERIARAVSPDELDGSAFRARLMEKSRRLKSLADGQKG